MTKGLGNNNAAERQVSVPLPAGTLRNLRVKLSAKDQGSHGFGLWVNGVGSPIGCSTWAGPWPPYADSQRFDHCESNPAISVTINAGDVISIGIGDGGTPYDPGDKTARFSIEFIPAVP